MNFKHLDRKTRSLLEALADAAIEEKYEITDVDDDGDTVVVTFLRHIEATEPEGEDEEDE